MSVCSVVCLSVCVCVHCVVCLCVFFDMCMHIVLMYLLGSTNYLRLERDGPRRIWNLTSGEISNK